MTGYVRSDQVRSG